MLGPIVDPSVIHNLIPGHLQSTSQSASLDGTPGYPSALIMPNLVNANTLLAAAALTQVAAAQAQQPATTTTLEQQAALSQAAAQQLPITIPLSATATSTTTIVPPSTAAVVPLFPPSPLAPHPPPSVVPVLTVQDRNMTIFPPPTPVYQGINPTYITTSGKRPRLIH